MRCLGQTGYLNFRMRALVTSFLTHHLFQHWQAGGWHLARQFTDFEPGIHYSQLQLQSGILASDRQPVRIYNPVKQSKEHDPEGVFIKQWIPELAACPTAYIHEPWTIPLEEQAAIHLRIGIDYPVPIIDIKTTSRHARTQLYQPRQSNKNKAS
jgi:deoxyribodipyrimidine photo-lyase